MGVFFLQRYLNAGSRLWTGCMRLFRDLCALIAISVVLPGSDDKESEANW